MLQLIECLCSCNRKTWLMYVDQSREKDNPYRYGSGAKWQIALSQQDRVGIQARDQWWPRAWKPTEPHSKAIVISPMTQLAATGGAFAPRTRSDRAIPMRFSTVNEVLDLTLWGPYLLS